MRTMEEFQLCLPLAVLLTMLLLPLSLGLNLVSDAEMKPDNPTIEAGSTLTLNCTLSQNYTGPYNVTDIIFQHGNVLFGHPNLTLLSSRTVQLQLPNVTVEHNGRFTCFFPNNTSLGLLAAQNVHVARRPLMPVLKGCIVDNWELMNCSWGPSLKVQQEHTESPKSFRQSLWWKYLGDGDDWKPCPNNVSETCIWCEGNFKMGASYCVRVNVSNSIASSISSDVMCVHTEEIVKPKPPTNIRSSFIGDEVRISWDPPYSPYHYETPLIYLVAVQYEFEKEVRYSIIANSTSLVFPVIPYTFYDVRISVSPSGPGFPSEDAVASLTTPSSTPCKNPIARTNAFSIDHSNAAERRIKIYWLPVRKQDYCGPGFVYVIRVRRLLPPVDSKQWEIASESDQSNSMEVNLDRYAYDIEILAKNTNGWSSHQPAVIHIPSSDRQLLSNYELIVEGQDKVAVVHWFGVAKVENVTGFTLFWCQVQSVSHICKTPIRWQDLDASAHDLNLTVDQNFLHFQYGLGVNFSGGRTSGINWASKLYFMASVPDSPKDLDILPSLEKYHGELRVKWTIPHCFKDCAYIQSFVIFYCIVDRDNLCQGDTKNVTVNSKLLARSGTTEEYGIHDLTDLEHFTKYKVWMISVARQGSSSFSDYVYGTTTEPWATPGKIAGIAAGVLVASTIVLFGLYVTFRCCDKYRKKLTSGVKISLPPSQRVQLASTSSETPMLRNQTQLDYSRQHSHMSTISGDSGHYSFAPSSPAMLPLLEKDADNLKQLQNLLEPKSVENRYHTTNFISLDASSDGQSLGKTEADEDNGPVDVLSYKVLPTCSDNRSEDPVDVDVVLNGKIFGQAPYVPSDQINQIANGIPTMNSSNWLLTDRNKSDVSYCTDLSFAAHDIPSDIGYAKIEQLQPFYPSNHLPSVGASDNRTEDSNLLVQFDSNLDTEGPQIPAKSLPAVSHLDELLATLYAGPPLIDGLQFDKGSLTASENYPLPSTAREDELSFHSIQTYPVEEQNNSESNFVSATSEPIDCGYVAHARLFGVD